MHREDRSDVALGTAFARVVELACRLPQDVPVDQLLSLAKRVLSSRNVPVDYRDAVRRYDDCVTGYLRDATNRLQAEINRDLKMTWLGTVSFFSQIRPNELLNDNPPCRITYFHNSERDDQTGDLYQLPIYFEKTRSVSGKLSFEPRASRPGEDSRAEVEKQFQELLNWLKCPPANLVSYLGSSISISCDRYINRLWSHDPAEIVDRISEPFQLYTRLRDLTEECVLRLKNECDPAKKTAHLIKYKDEVDSALVVASLNLKMLTDARNDAIEEIRFDSVPLRSGLPRPICRPGGCDWTLINEMIENLQPLEKEWGYEVMLEPLFAIAAAGGWRLNVYFSGLKPTRSDYHKADERTLCGLVAMALNKTNAEHFQHKAQFHQMMNLFSRALMTPLAQIEALAQSDHKCAARAAGGM